MIVKRHEWEDALIKAQANGIIGNGPLLLALKLASAINWKPKDRRGSGLYWKNEDAVSAVGSSRATYFRHCKELRDLGFFIEVGGNLLPRVPDLAHIETTESHTDTEQSQTDTNASHNETEKSQSDRPLSEDAYSEESLSDDSCSEDSFNAPTAALTRPVPSFANTSTSSLLSDEPRFLDSVEESGQSQSETRCPMESIPSLHHRYHSGKPCPAQVARGA